MQKTFRRSFLSLLAISLFSSAALADVTIAVVGAMGGSFKKIGVEFKQGVRGAVEEINSKGGLLGKKLKYIVRDDDCNKDKAVKIAHELVELKVTMVMGHLCSDASIAASTIYEKAGIIEISPSSTNPKYTDRGYQLIFRTTGRDDMQGFVIAEHIIRSYKTKKLGILFEDNDYSKGVVEVTKKFLNQAGIKEAFHEKAPTEPYDFSTIIEKMDKEKIEVLLFPGLPASVEAFAAQAKKAGTKVRLIGSDAFSGVTFTKENRRHMDGAQFSFPPDPKDDRRNKKVVKKYKSEGYKPEAFTFYSYGAVEVWAKAVAKAGTFDASKVAQTLRTEKFDTVLGEINFDEKGDVSNPGFVMYIFNKGKRYYLE